MPPPRERRWPWIAAGYAVVFAVTATVTAFIYDSAAPANRAMVIRIAVGFAVAVLLIQLRRYFRGDPRWDPPSEFEDALTPQPPTPKLDPAFVKWRNDVRNGIASRSFFNRVLWPRLSALSGASRGPGHLPMPVQRGRLGRGPSARTVAALVDRIAGELTDRG
jgi:hypothetical protein